MRPKEMSAGWVDSEQRPPGPASIQSLRTKSPHLRCEISTSPLVQETRSGYSFRLIVPTSGPFGTLHNTHAH